jgi:hypothetical protein
MAELVRCLNLLLPIEHEDYERNRHRSELLRALCDGETLMENSIYGNALALILRALILHFLIPSGFFCFLKA